MTTCTTVHNEATIMAMRSQRMSCWTMASQVIAAEPNDHATSARWRGARVPSRMGRNCTRDSVSDEGEQIAKLNHGVGADEEQGGDDHVPLRWEAVEPPVLRLLIGAGIHSAVDEQIAKPTGRPCRRGGC